MIKKGVLTGQRNCQSQVRSVPGRPIIHVLPLSQIIQTMEGASSPNTKKCRMIYTRFIETFGNEIAVLTDIPVSEIRNIHPGVGGAITALRNGTVTLHPGGGGKYGTFSLISES